jgi:phosphoribosyl-ATP pyrophosphohydrolase/phosphoribosyl-AMP cyclohydrolase
MNLEKQPMSTHPKTSVDITRVRFDERGLVPCIVQSEHGDVRMLGYMNEASLLQTQATGRVTFFSRSRQKLWVKGETSGHFLHLRSLSVDCDGDALLCVARCEGPTCHTGTRSCFSPEAAPGTSFLAELETLLQGKKASASKEGSYTEKLFASGTDRIAKKVVEEAGEVVIAAKTLDADAATRADFLGEAADLVFHLTMLLAHEGATLSEVAEVLRARHAARSPDAAAAPKEQP